jgi:hypothetical protein
MKGSIKMPADAILADDLLEEFGDRAIISFH